MRRRWTWWLAWGTWLVVLALYGVALAIIEIVGYSVATQQDTWEARTAILLAFVAFATVGALVASRQPRNAIGWIYLTIAVLVALSVIGGEYANYVFVEEPGSLPGGYVSGWFYLWTWFPVLGLIAMVPLLFPDGRVPGPRWRYVLYAMIACIVLTAGLWMLKPGVMSDPKEPLWPDNPIGIGALDPIYDYVEAVSSLALGVLLVLAVASSIVRFLRSRGDERQQLKWMTYGVGVWIVVIPLSMLATGDLSDILFAFTIAVLPAATAIGILKYRLYEIDRVISKTLVYASLTVILVAAYGALVLAGQAVFSSFAGGSDLAIAVSTLGVAVLFLPLRSRVQRFVDRRFYRRRYDAQRTLDAFGARLRDEVDLATLTTELRGVVQETVQPAHVSLWLREGVRT